MLFYLLGSDSKLEKFMQKAEERGKKPEIIAILKLYKEIVLSEEFTILKEQRFYRVFTEIFFSFFTKKNNLIKSLFLELFQVIIQKKAFEILVNLRIRENQQKLFFFPFKKHLFRKPHEFELEN